MFQLYFMLTNKCNLYCNHCIRGNQDTFKEMEYENALIALDKVANWNRNAMLILTGGEPTIYSHFEDILKYAIQRFAKVVINTNGTTSYFMENWEKYACAKNLLIQISLDGTEKYHDNIRGEGAFRKSIGLLNFLNERGYKVCVSTTVNKHNINSLFELCGILGDLKIYKWHISPQMPFGRAKLNECITTDRWNIFVMEIIKVARVRLSIRKLFDMKKLDSLNSMQIEELSQKCICNCGTGRRKAYVDYKFEVCACTCIPDYKAGNLMRNNMVEIMESQVMREIRRIKVNEGSPCIKCKYLKICNGGCLGMSKQMFGILGEGDVRCEKVREYYEKKTNTIL